MQWDTGIVESDKPTNDVAHWYAIHTNSKQEDRANYNLQGWGVETFSPKTRERRYLQGSKAGRCVVKSLFPRYIFARFNAKGLLHKVRFTRGVHSIVNCEGKPVSIEDEIVPAIQSRIDPDGFIRLDDDLKPGEKVVITAGLFRGLSGIFERRLKDSDRVVILLTSIGYQANLTLEWDQIKCMHDTSGYQSVT